jgi:hypothetical protein
VPHARIAKKLGKSDGAPIAFDPSMMRAMLLLLAAGCAGQLTASTELDGSVLEGAATSATTTGSSPGTGGAGGGAGSDSTTGSATGVTTGSNVAAGGAPSGTGLGDAASAGPAVDGGFGGSSGGGPVVGEDAGEGSCAQSYIHVAYGGPPTNSDFDYKSVCNGDTALGSRPVGYFVKGQPGELVIAGCAGPDAPSPELHFVISSVSGPAAYSANAISFVDPKLNRWQYEGTTPSTQLGWTTTITTLDPVGGTISGHYIGKVQSNLGDAYLMGTFTVCHVPDQPPR